MREINNVLSNEAIDICTFSGGTFTYFQYVHNDVSVMCPRVKQCEASSNERRISFLTKNFHNTKQANELLDKLNEFSI